MTSPEHMNNCAQQPKENIHQRHENFELSYEIATIIHFVLVKLPHPGGDQISSAVALAFDVQLLGLADPM